MVKIIFTTIGEGTIYKTKEKKDPKCNCHYFYKYKATLLTTRHDYVITVCANNVASFDMLLINFS